MGIWVFNEVKINMGRAKAHLSIANLSKAKLHKAMRVSVLWGLGKVFSVWFSGGRLVL